MPVYRFMNVWHIPFPPDQVWDVLARPGDYPRWWGKVYLECEALDGDEPHEGGRVRVKTKGWLPYILRWTVQTTKLERPSLIQFKAWGDFNTQESRWVLTPEEGGTQAVLYWNPRVEKLIVKLLSPALRPLFKSNHYWAMNEGEQRIVEYLQRAAPTGGG